ncbi:MAG TPA: Ig-like domain-containing protein, partial [Polyangiaceae bacterium]|nr:Ig-like domain-containing protein [Polyangiaceae bacterium]
GDAGKVCGSKHAELGAVILEVRSTTLGGTASFVFPDALTLSGDIAGGRVPEVDLEVPPTASFTGRTFAEVDTPAACAAADGSVPATVELRDSTSLSSYSTFSTELSGQTVAEPGSPIAAHRFAIDAPPGVYDVYIAPQAMAEGCTPPPPRLYKGVEVPADVSTVEFTAPDDSPLRLGGTLVVPPDVSLDGWFLEIVDPKYGKIISESAPLATPTAGEDTVPIIGADGAPEGIRYYFTEQALLRLRDADGSLSVHWALGALDFDGDGIVKLDLRDLVATPMPLAATIIDADGNFVPGAHVTLRSVTLTGDANNNAVYRATADTDASGQIEVRLVPGTYAVTIVPSVPGAATFYGDWVVTKDGGNGKGFQLAAQPQLGGTVHNPLGGILSDAPVVVTPALEGSTDYFTLALGEPAAVTRELSSSLDATGSFAMPVDPGNVDVSVRLPADAGFPWIVVPRTQVLPSEQEPVHDLGTLEVPTPVVVRGAVTSPTGAISLGVVRAWLAVDPTLGASGPLVQIGEVVTDDAGQFFLPLPPSITLPEPKSTP